MAHCEARQHFFEALRPVCNSTLNNEPQNQGDTVTAESDTTGSTELLVITAVFQFLQYRINQIVSLHAELKQQRIFIWNFSLWLVQTQLFHLYWVKAALKL